MSHRITNNQRPLKQIDDQSSLSPMSLSTLLKGIWHQLSRRKRLQLGAALLLMFVSGVAEVMSLAIAVPFLGVLTNPQQFFIQPFVKRVAEAFGVTSAEQLLLPVTIVFVFVAVLAAAVRLLNLWVNVRLAASIGSDFSCEAYKRTLYQPYSVHMQTNSSGLIAAISTYVGQTVSTLTSVLQLMNASVVTLCILGTLLAIDWFVACVAVFAFGTAYSFLVFIARRRLGFNSRLIALAQKEQIKSLQEGLGAIRDVLLDGSQSVFIDIYQSSDGPMRMRSAQNNFLARFPRYALEALGLALIALLALLLSWQRGGTLTIVPLLGTLALGSQRLLPAMQQIYASWASIRSTSTGVEQVINMLNQPLPSESMMKDLPPLKLNEAIEVKTLRFRYTENSPFVLDGLDLKIIPGEKIGIIGRTGSGKSTFVDLLMGLLEPTEGQILVDGLNLNEFDHPERLNAWRASIAHVPQSIYLADSSIEENIAFGVPVDQIDHERVRDAAYQANIGAFIESTQDGYRTFVGERGVRLSGGQRQRLGIARALYKKAKFLVLDEATSALDSDTEDAVMDSINRLGRNLTVVIIAHRLITISKCDRVIRLDQGCITADGTPSDILKRFQ